MDPGRASLAKSGSLIAPALTLVNLVGYVLAVAASRAFDKDAYGELSALLGVLLVASVPALALQAVVARSLARRPANEPPGPRERALLARASAAGLGVAAVALAASPLVAAFLHSSVAGAAWVAAGLAPLAVLSACMGVLQGEERFGALAAVICAQALGKGIGALPLIADVGPATVLAALALGTTVAMAAALLLVGRQHRGATTGLPTTREALVATGSLLVLLALANLDLLLARNVLSGDESGRYSAGAVLAKAAFWLPQAVAVVVFPRLTDPEGGREVLRKGLLVVGGLGALELGGCLLLAKPVLEITFGSSYGSLSGIAWLWVLQGACLSLVQLLVYRAIATRDAVTSWLVGSAALLEVVVVLTLSPTKPGPVIAFATGIAAVLTTGLLVRSLSAPRRPRSDPRPR